MHDTELCFSCRVYGPWLDGAVQQVEAGLNLTLVLTAEGQCFQMGETGASGKVKWEGCKEPELVSPHSCTEANTLAIHSANVVGNVSDLVKHELGRC